MYIESVYPHTVFLMATFGEGEPTDNAVSFYEWMMDGERAHDTSLDNTDFAVFALGNTQYDLFCHVGRKMDKRLGELRGNRLVQHGEGDDDNDMDEDFAQWKEKFWEVRSICEY